MAANYGVYVTFEEVKEYLQGEQSAGFHTKDDDRIKRFCIEASRTFDAFCRRRFYPRKEQRTYDHPGGIAYPEDNGPLITSVLSGTAYCPPELILDDDLLEVITFTTKNTATTVSSSDYFLLNGQDRNRSPYDRIQLKTNGDQTSFEYNGTTQEANAVTAFWGYHEDWSNAWAEVDSVQDNPLSSSATQVTVADADGTDEQGLNKRFRVQQLIRFGTGTSAEYAYITGIDADNDTLDIVREVNGTTATSQTNGTSIYVYRPISEIVLVLKVLASYAYRRKDSVGNPEDRAVASSTGVVIMPSTLPDEVKRMLSVYRRVPRDRRSYAQVR